MSCVAVKNPARKLLFGATFGKGPREFLHGCRPERQYNTLIGQDPGARSSGCRITHVGGIPEMSKSSHIKATICEWLEGTSRDRKHGPSEQHVLEAWSRWHISIPYICMEPVGKCRHLIG
jgi:hypothetical protein